MTLRTPLATTWSIDDIVGQAKAGKLVLPVFQRSFRWERKDILKLFDSLYRGYPIGNLLVWDTEPPEGAAARFGPLLYEAGRDNVLLIIDGQQRITCLVATLLGGGDKDSRFEVYFDLEANTFKHSTSGERAGSAWLPMTEVADTIRYLEWLQRHNLADYLVHRANSVVRALRDYKVPVYTVRGGKDQEGEIREIFKRLNTTGKALREAEIFNALHGGAKGEGLARVAESLDDLRFGQLNQTWLLKALAATLGLERSRTVSVLFAEQSVEERERDLRRVESALLATVSFLRDDARITHWSLLPYRFPIIPMSAFFARYPGANSKERALLRRWLWLGASSGRHAVITHPIIRDVLEIVKTSENALDAAQRLHARVESESPTLELGTHNLRKAATKIVGAVLADLEPQHLIRGERLDLAEVMDAEQPFPQVIVRTRAGTETRLLHPMMGRGAASNSRRMVALLTSGDVVKHVLASHAINDDAIGHLMHGDPDGFLEARKKLLGESIQGFLKRMTEE